jgi:hypothetical protein
VPEPNKTLYRRCRSEDAHGVRNMSKASIATVKKTRAIGRENLWGCYVRIAPEARPSAEGCCRSIRDPIPT